MLIIITYPKYSLMSLNVLFTCTISLIIVYRFLIALYGFFLPLPHKEEIFELKRQEFPIYTIIVPLYQENAISLGKLVDSLNKLDYPQHKLDIKIVLEKDDTETIKILKRMQLPMRFNCIIWNPGNLGLNPKPAIMD